MNVSRHVKTIATSLVGLGVIAIAGAIVWSSHTPATSAAKPPALAAASSLSVVDGVTMIQVDVATQRRSGIIAQPLAAATHRGETTVVAQVLDLQPLIDVRSRRDAAQAELIAARAAAGASREEAERSRALYEDHRNISLKTFEAARAADRADQAKAAAAELSVRNIEAGARQQFGRTLAGAAFDPHSPTFERLLARQDVLIRVTLPPEAGTRAPGEIDVQASGSARAPGSLVSLAAQADPGLAGSSFLYQVPTPLPAGASVVAYLPTSRPAQGVLVPSSAVVWYAGQPWVYVRVGAARFARRPLGAADEVETGYFVAQGMKPGERVVVTGAGLLMSEEQRPPVGGAGCKDPECD